MHWVCSVKALKHWISQNSIGTSDAAHNLYMCDWAVGKRVTRETHTYIEIGILKMTMNSCVGHRGSVVVCTMCKQEISGSTSPAGLNLVWRALRQGFYLCALSWPRSKLVPGRTGKACVFEWFLCTGNGSRAVCCSLRSWDGLWVDRSCDQGVIVWKSGEMHCAQDTRL